MSTCHINLDHAYSPRFCTSTSPNAFSQAINIVPNSNYTNLEYQNQACDDYELSTIIEQATAVSSDDSGSNADYVSESPSNLLLFTSSPIYKNKEEILNEIISECEQRSTADTESSNGFYT